MRCCGPLVGWSWRQRSAQGLKSVFVDFGRVSSRRRARLEVMKSKLADWRRKSK